MQGPAAAPFDQLANSGMTVRSDAAERPFTTGGSGSRPCENAQLILRRHDIFDFEADKSKTSNLHAWKSHVVSGDFRSADVLTRPRSTPASLAGHLDFFTACAQSNAQHSPPESEALKKPVRFCRLLPPEAKFFCPAVFAAGGRDRPLPVPGTGVLSATVFHMRRSTFDPIP